MMKYDVVSDDTLDTFITKALEELSGPNRGWKYNRYSDGRKEIEWFDISEGLEPVPHEEIMERAKQLELDWLLIKYKFDRQKVYPKIEDQLDEIYKYFQSEGIENTFTSMIKTVKEQFPKPE